MRDEELLRAYATERSEQAFTALVRRHAGAVQAAAMRQTGNAHLAEEVTHAVVRGFVTELQRNLASDRRTELARAVEYSLRVNTPDGASLIPDEGDLLNRFDSIFRPNVVGVILKSPNRRLYCDPRGVMVGDGTVWIAPSKTPGRAEPRIIALNLP